MSSAAAQLNLHKLASFDPFVFSASPERDARLWLDQRAYYHRTSRPKQKNKCNCWKRLHTWDETTHEPYSFVVIANKYGANDCPYHSRTKAEHLKLTILEKSLIIEPLWIAHTSPKDLALARNRWYRNHQYKHDRQLYQGFGFVTILSHNPKNGLILLSELPTVDLLEPIATEVAFEVLDAILVTNRDDVKEVRRYSAWARKKDDTKGRRPNIITTASVPHERVMDRFYGDFKRQKLRTKDDFDAYRRIADELSKEREWDA